MIIGIDHGYYAIKTKQVCFPTGLMRYTYEPYTMQNLSLIHISEPTRP